MGGRTKSQSSRARQKRAEKSGTSNEVSLPDSRWQELTASFPDHPALKSDFLYALPAALLDAIDREASDFFSAEDREFERKLADLADGASFLRRPFRDSLQARATGEAKRDSTGADDNPSDELDRRWRESERRIREMLVDGMRESGRSEEEIERFFAQERRFQANLSLMQSGYAGWLVTDPGFRRERDEFCRRWRERIRRDGAFPRVPMSLMGESPPGIPRRQREFYADYMAFYRRWDLECLATWELPVPLRAEFLTHSLYHLPSLSEAGVTIFVPYFLLRDRSLALYDVAAHQELLQPADHLREWLTTQNRNWGPERYSLMYELYVFLELALRRRYGKKRGHVGNLDRAIARYQDGPKADEMRVSATAESIRKTRQEMERRLQRYARGQD